MADSPLSSLPASSPPGSAAYSASSAQPRPDAKPQHRDSLREVFETVVFVVALVLMLKLFVVEAFVIPTGSMAETLYGYQKIVTCPECGFVYPVNSSDEVSPSDGRPRQVVGACCPNCRYRVRWDRNNPSPPSPSGDRVLVHKAQYSFESPERGDVVVFKYPVDPQVNGEQQNYIKRLCGFGGETIAINSGDLYRTTAPLYNGTTEVGAPRFPRPANPLDAWYGPEVELHSKTTPPFEPKGPDYTYHNAEPAREQFAASRQSGFAKPVDSGFELIRKTDAMLETMKRIVYDNDHQSEYLASKGVPPRWNFEPGSGWTTTGANGMPKTFTHSGENLNWVRYQHLAPQSDDVWEKLANGYEPGLLPPTVITNFMGYNSGVDRDRGAFRESGEHYWTGDLILETEATIGAASDEVVLELSKGANRFQAIFAGGNVRLVRTGPNGKELATRPSGVTTAGTYRLRFANVDCRLRVWVNGTAIDFGTDADYQPDRLPEQFDPEDRMHEGWTHANDVLAPASLGAKGTVTFDHLKLWRDTYYTYTESSRAFDEIARYVDTYYVQPGHYLCLGDNSAQSSDSRRWGTVPQRLMLGKAVFVFFPIDRIGFIE